MTPTESVLVELWSGILGVESFGIHDEVLGRDRAGHVTQLCARVHHILGKRLLHSALLDTHTIAHLAARLDCDDVLPRTLVPIHRHGAKVPLFFAPGVDGDVLVLRHLARHLGQGQPFYALQPRELELTTSRVIPIETLATRYVDAMRSVTATGPFLMAGTPVVGVWRSRWLGS